MKPSETRTLLLASIGGALGASMQVRGILGRAMFAHIGTITGDCTCIEPLLTGNALAVSSIAKPISAPENLLVRITKLHLVGNSGCVTRARQLQIETHPVSRYSRMQVIASSI